MTPFLAIIPSHEGFTPQIHAALAAEENLAMSTGAIALPASTKPTFFAKFKTFFKKLFGNEPKWSKVALNTLEVTGPLLQTAIVLVEPEAAPLTAAVLGVVQADLAKTAAIIDQGVATPTLPGILDDIKLNLSSIEQMAEIKDPATKDKITAIVTTIIDEIEAIAAEVPASHS